MKNIALLPIALLALTAGLHAQEGRVPTQTLIQQDAKNPTPLSVDNVVLKVDNRATPVNSVAQVLPSQAQVALLLDDGLRQSFGRNLDDIEKFIATLPPGVEILIGYMQNGRVAVAQPFTTDHAAAVSRIRVPFGQPGMSASPYFCVSEFTKHWPGEPAEGARNPEAMAPTVPSGTTHKARFILMITNGVDPYNGSTSIMNQNSPYVETAIHDAQRAGVPLYSIFFTDAGFRGGNFSGQSYLSQAAEETGGTAYFEGTSNPVSLEPFFKRFVASMTQTYVASFDASGRDLVRLKVATNLPKTKLRAADQVLPGTQVVN